jgi:hypothetical protein
MGLQSSSTAAPREIRIEQLKSAEELIALAGMKAVAVKYSGGDVEFWIEIETHGQKTKEGRFGPKQLPFDKPPGPSQTVAGYYLLVRIPEEQTGKETWRMAYQRDIVAAQSSTVQLPMPAAQLNGSLARGEGQSNKVSSATKSFQLWENTNGETAETSASSVRSPLPPDQEVCLTEIKGKQKREGEFVEVFKIRVMGKALSDQDRAARDKKVPSPQEH